jgi:lysozyme family protein
MSPAQKRIDMGKAIVEFEGRYAEGKLQWYKLPPGDGGGAFEVAGINERYHPGIAQKLRALIEAGQHGEAEAEASAYIQNYTGSVLEFFPPGINPDQYPQIEFLLRDVAFNRGHKGAATVLQHALGVTPVDGVVGSRTKVAFGVQLADPAALASRITKARETYERRAYPWKPGKRDESSKFWKGLASRWAKAHAVAGTRFG